MSGYLQGYLPVDARGLPYDGQASGLDATEVQGAIDELGEDVVVLEVRVDALELGTPGASVDTTSAPGNVDLTSTPLVRRGRSALAAAAISFTITHPRLTTGAYVTAQLEGSVARTFSCTYSAGSVTVLTSTNTAIAINWYIHRYGDEG